MVSRGRDRRSLIFVVIRNGHWVAARRSFGSGVVGATEPTATPWDCPPLFARRADPDSRPRKDERGTHQECNTTGCPVGRVANNRRDRLEHIESSALHTALARGAGARQRSTNSSSPNFSYS